VTGWTDAHCHLQEEFLTGDDDVRASVADTLARAAAAGVARVVVIGTGLQTSREAVAMAEQVVGPVEIFSTVGLHPHDATAGTGAVAALAREGSARLVGIGECGLDYQIALAHELDLALVIHARDAWDDLYEILASEGVPARTVIHCFTGGPNEASRCVQMGCDISISGIVTFKNAQPIRDAVLETPLDRLHVETDSPFLAPVPFRGRANEPAYVVQVGTYLARLLDRDVDELRLVTAANSARLFALS
jgi:TatD DNase family protein